MTHQIFKKTLMGLALVLSFLSITSSVQAQKAPLPKAENPFAEDAPSGEETQETAPETTTAFPETSSETTQS